MGYDSADERAEIERLTTVLAAIRDCSTDPTSRRLASEAIGPALVIRVPFRRGPCAPPPWTPGAA